MTPGERITKWFQDEGHAYYDELAEKIDNDLLTLRTQYAELERERDALRAEIASDREWRDMWISDRDAAQLRRLERDAAFIAKETEAELLEWLLTALEQRRAHVKGNVLKRLQKLLEGE